MSEPAIAVENLGKRFGSVVAVDGLSFTVPAGHAVALLGANGAGKTTTLAMLLGLLLPTTGDITVLGENMIRHRNRVLARLNFSSPYLDLPYRLTVRHNLYIYAKLYGVRKARERIAELAAELDFARFLDRPFGQLSAGEKSRVSLAKALANRPRLPLPDEHTASLDPDRAYWVRGYLGRYQKETGATFLLASHNMAEVERLCDDVLMMKTGRLVDHGTPKALIERYGRNTLEEVFLDIARGRRSDERAAE